MLHFTIRDALWLTVVVVLGTVVFLTRSARENDRRSAIHRASEQELEAIRARYKAAKEEFEWHVTRWHTPPPERTEYFSYKWSVDGTCDAIERFAYAAETSSDLETQVKDLRTALELAQYLASNLMEKKDEYGDIKTSPPFYRIQYTCADIEGRLRRAEQNLTSARLAR